MPKNEQLAIASEVAANQDAAQRFLSDEAEPAAASTTPTRAQPAAAGNPDCESADVDVILRELEGRGIGISREKPGMKHPLDGAIYTLLQLSDCPFFPDETHANAAFLMDYENGGVGFKCKGGRCGEADKRLPALLDLLGLERRAFAPEPPAVVVPANSKLKWGLATSIRTEAIDFLWGNRIVVNHLNLLLGDEKVGKGVLMCRIAEMATTGQLTGRPMRVAISSTEDRWGVTMKPRLQAAGADLTMVHVLTDLTFPDEIPALEVGIAEHGVELLLIDPIHAHFGRGFNIKESQDMNFVLNSIADAADRAKVTTLGTIHTNRLNSASTRARMAHSQEFARVARSTVVIGYSPDGAKNERLVGHDMANYSARAHTVNAAIESVPFVTDDGERRTQPIMSLDGPSDFTVDQILAHDIDSEAREKQRAEAETRWGHCANEMRAVQQAYGDLRVPAREFDAMQSDYSNDTRMRAKRALDINSQKKGGSWVWVFPPVTESEAGRWADDDLDDF